MSGTASGVYPCYENQFQIDVSSTSTASWKTIADCTSFSVAFDNNVEEWTPFEQEGWIRRLMTGKGVTITVNAKRNVGDDGNDAVAALAWLNGRNCEKPFQGTCPDGTGVQFNDAVFNVKDIGAGESTDVAPLNFEVLSNGKPTVTPAV